MQMLGSRGDEQPHCPCSEVRGEGVLLVGGLVEARYKADTGLILSQENLKLDDSCNTQ